MQPNLKFSLKELAVKRINNYPGRPTIVFLHDSLGCIELWKDFPEKLGKLANCNVFIYDRQGYGKSCPFTYSKREKSYLEDEADILIALTKDYGISKAILYGHSDGGSIAFIAAGKYQENILGIITEGAHVFLEDITIDGIEKAIKLYKETDLKNKLKKYHGSNTDDMFWMWAETWTSDDFKDWNIEDILSSITCPSLVIQGAEDEYGTIEQVERIINQTKGRSEKMIIPYAQHTPHKENPGITLNISKEFINNLLVNSMNSADSK